MSTSRSQPGRTKARRSSARRRPRVLGSPAQTAFEESLLGRIQSVVSHLTCREIAEATGVHPETVRRYVTKDPPTMFFVAALCRAFKVYPSWLLGLAEPRPAKRRRPR